MRRPLTASHKSAKRYRLLNVSREIVVATNVQCADTLRQRARGLLGTTELSRTGGLILEPCRQVHMHGMTYALLAVYCDRHGRVLTCPVLVPGQRGPFLWHAAVVIELPVVDAELVAVGDMLRWWTVEEGMDDGTG